LCHEGYKKTDRRRLVRFGTITPRGWQPDAAPGFSWPDEHSWVNPRPNAPNLSLRRVNEIPAVR
jgi:hypothetical protein